MPGAETGLCPQASARPPGRRQSPEEGPRPGGAALVAGLVSPRLQKVENSWGLHQAQVQSPHETLSQQTR